jgi:hypothetical protein
MICILARRELAPQTTFLFLLAGRCANLRIGSNSSRPFSQSYSFSLTGLLLPDTGPAEAVEDKEAPPGQAGRRAIGQGSMPIRKKKLAPAGERGAQMAWCPIDPSSPNVEGAKGLPPNADAFEMMRLVSWAASAANT